MANKIKLKRGLSTSVSSLQLETGELAVTTDTGELYVGDKDKKVLKINNNTTYTLTKSGSTITLKGSDGSTQSVSDSNTTYSAATQSANGLMSSTDKTKLDGIATGANKYSLPTASSSTLGGVKVGTNLSISSGVLSATDTTYSAATQSTAGLMSASDKTKLDGIATGANKITVDTALSSSSTNPVQNKVINAALANKANTSTTVSTSNIVTSFDIEDTFDNNKIYNANAVLEFANLVGMELSENYATKSDVPTKTSQLTNDSGFKTTDNNTTYTISKSGSTITLTGSDGKTSTVTDSNTTYSAATTSANGLMSSSDKTKLNGIATGAQVNNVVVSTSQPTASTAEVWVNPNGALDLSALWDKLYPIGSVYMSTSSTNPGTLFGGTWAQITGRFLYCTTTSKTTGGSETHTHTGPSHSHTYGIAMGAFYGAAGYESSGYTGVLQNGTGDPAGWASWTSANVTNNSNATSSSKTNNNAIQKSTANTGASGTGNTGASSSLPPYFTVYCWYRTA